MRGRQGEVAVVYVGQYVAEEMSRPWRNVRVPRRGTRRARSARVMFTRSQVRKSDSARRRGAVLREAMVPTRQRR